MKNEILLIFDKELISYDIQQILHYIKNTIHINISNIIVDNQIIFQTVKILENDLNLNSFCGKEIIKMLIEITKYYPLASNIFTLFALNSLKFIFDSELHFDKSKIIDFMHDYKDILSNYFIINLQQSFNFLEDDLFFSHPSYKDLFNNLFKIINKSQSRVRISIYRVTSGKSFLNEKSNFNIRSGLFLKLKVFDKNKLFDSISGSNSSLKFDQNNNLIFIRNLLLYNNPTRTFDINYIRLLCNNQSIWDDNEIIVYFIENILIIQKIDIMLIIGTDVQSEIKAILLDYGILIFEFLSSHNLKLISEFFSLDNSNSSNIISNSLSSSILILNKERFTLSLDYISSNLIVFNDKLEEISLLNITINGFCKVFTRSQKHIITMQLYRMIRLIGDERVITVNKKVFHKIESKILDLIEIMKNIKKILIIKENFENEKILLFEILNSSFNWVNSSIYENLEIFNLNTNLNLKYFMNGNEILECFDQFCYFINYVIYKFYL